MTGGLTDDQVGQGLNDPGADVRAWTIQLALEGGKPSPAVYQRLVTLARDDPSPVVRLYVASGLQRLPPGQRRECPGRTRVPCRGRGRP